jgi:hypothetical protein
MAGWGLIGSAQIAAAILAAPGVSTAPVASPAVVARALVPAPVPSDDTYVRDSTGMPDRDWLLGYSGKLRARFFSQLHPSAALPALERLFGEFAVEHAGVYPVRDSTLGAGETYSFITLLPFSTKQHGRVGPYRVGWWPAERHRLRSPEYANPDGFIEVTSENEDTPVSEHFRLRDFLTHDQEDVWPKYLVLRESLVDKLELIIDDLAAHGRPDAHLVIMSGFRSPQYNAQGVGQRGGRARDSRHQFGDAADIYVDDGNGRMCDLNGDGHVDTRDVRVLLESVDRVEDAHPELVGGAGVYRATRAHGPFLHVDVRGERVRWAFSEPLPSAGRHRKIHHGTPNAQRSSGGTAGGGSERSGS